MNNDVVSFTISVSEPAIEQLNAKLLATSFADRVEFSDAWNYASPLGDVQRLAKRPPTFSQSPLQYLLNALKPYTSSDKAGLARSVWSGNEGFGYNVEQSTKPSTLGFALAVSPVALLAWVYEKLHDWTDDYAWDDDEILTWVSIYQFSEARPAASVRISYETKHAVADLYAQRLTYVPRVKLVVSLFPKDVVVPPQRWAHSLGPVAFAAVHDQGGHFAAHERPDLFAQDLRSMFGRNGGAHDVARKFDPSL
ncbi:hypothetical protein PWT90_01214 [Aphanocladium album]|nr:hypothetical protein PWT90_01214 [Aphanocladium album]